MYPLQVLLKRIEAGSFDDPAPGGGGGGGGAAGQGHASSPGTPIPGGAGSGMNGPPPPPHSVGVPSAPTNLGGPQQWAGMAPRGGMPGAARSRSDEARMMAGPGGHMGLGPGSGAGAGRDGEPPGGGQGSGKRPRISSGNGSGGSGGANSPAGPAVGNGSGNGNSGGGGVGRSGTPAMEEPPPMPPSLSSGMSQMVVTRPNTGGGDGVSRRGGPGERGPSFGFGSALPSFAEGGGGAAGAAGGPPPSAVRLAQERSLPTGVTDPAEVTIFFFVLVVVGGFGGADVVFVVGSFAVDVCYRWPPCVQVDALLLLWVCGDAVHESSLHDADVYDASNMSVC